MVDACGREVRDLRVQCQRLSTNNQELKEEADAGRMAACCSKRAADAARKELEMERKLSGELRRVRDALLAAAAGDAKTISRLQAQLCKGAPSFRLLERARCLKQNIAKLGSQLKEQAVALSAKTIELERSRQDARALAAALGFRSETSSPSGEIKGGLVTVDELLEMGRVKLANHDLALEMASLSETSEMLAAGKQELEDRLSVKAAEVEKCYAEAAKMRDIVDRERKAADGHRTSASVANASARKAEELVESLRSKEKELVRDVSVAARRHEELEDKLKALSGAAERSEVVGARAEKLQTELDACGAECSAEKLRNAQTCAELRASEERWHRARQRVEALEKVEDEKRRLEDRIQEAENLQNTQREDIASVREELRVAVAERTELLRGLRLAKGFNDELAKGKERAEQREKEACARCVEMREGKLALQRALLEQLSATRTELCEEREKFHQAEATLGRLAQGAGIRSRCRPSPPADNGVCDNNGGGRFLWFEDGCVVGGNATSTSARVELARPRDTPVQDQLGREGAEQFLSDWDEERSSTSSSVSLSSSTLLVPPPSPPLVLSVPLGSASMVASCGGTDGGEGKSGVSVDRSTEAMPPRAKRQPSLPPRPRQPLPPEVASSSTDDTPGRHSPNRCGRRSGPRQSGQAGPSALAGACLNDASLEGWAASMVALGRAARAEAEAAPGDGAEPQSGLRRDLDFAAAALAPGEACATSGGAKRPHASSSAGRHHRSVRVLGDSSASPDSPPESHEDGRRRECHVRIRRGLLRQAHSPTKRRPDDDGEVEEEEKGEEEDEQEEENNGGGDDNGVEQACFASQGDQPSQTRQRGTRRMGDEYGEVEEEEKGEEENEQEEENNGGDDVNGAEQACSASEGDQPSRTRQRGTRRMGDESVGDGADATVAWRTAGIRLFATSSSSWKHRRPNGREGCGRRGGTGGTREDGGGDVGVRGAAGDGGRADGVVAGADRAQVASSVRSGGGGGCQGEEDGEGGIVDVAAAVRVADGEHKRPPRCSLLDLAHQSIEDI